MWVHVRRQPLMKNTLLSTITALSLFLAGTLSYGSVPRPEYPRPQFERSCWVNLNGEWSYELDQTLSGVEAKKYESKGFGARIIVPFCPESRLSGVGFSNSDFIRGIWYHRTVDIPSEWEGKTVLLNFGAVYYSSEIYIDGKFAARHFGGSDSFSVDITDFVTAGSRHNLVVFASSDLRSRMQSAGKQALRLSNFECTYTRTTGIWQTVWMEAVAPDGLERVRTTTDIDRGTVTFQVWPRSSRNGDILRTSVYDGDKVVALDEGPLARGTLVTLPVKNAKLWSPDAPFLYDVVFEVINGNRTVDCVKSYFGMRKIHIEGRKIFLNNEAFYQRLVLDQGWYPDGIWTAPSDEALRRDIEISLKAGFNGARLHQKVFEERFHYWADRLGYLTWGEFPSWGMDCNSEVAARNFISEWERVVVRDANHPSIIVWTPLNETFWPDEVQYPRFCEDIYSSTLSLDPTRPVCTSSGGQQIVQDIWTAHSYEQDAQKQWEKIWNGGKMFSRGTKAGDLQELPRGNVGFNPTCRHENSRFLVYDGSMPYLLDEWGGMKCRETNQGEGLWGYGKDPETREDYYKRLEEHVNMLASHPDAVWGWCFTQLTDVEQEQNGIYYFDRSEKFDMERIHKILTYNIIQ